MFLFIFTLHVAAQEYVKKMAPVQAMKAYEETYDSLMENVVNIKTPGYKAFDSTTIIDEEGNIVLKRSTRFTKGTLEQTNGKLDVALEGDGFFAVQSPQGVIYTRDGRFMLDQDYRLVSLVGKYPVLTTGGQIFLTPGGAGGSSEVFISPQGKIIQDKTDLGTLMIVVFEDTSVLERISGSFFRTPVSSIDPNKKIAGIVREEFTVKPGYIEASNVDLSRQLIELPLNSRKYDANSKVLQILRRTRQTAREMGRVQ